MIPKLTDILNEAYVHRYQIFSPGTGGKDAGNFKFNPNKIPTGKLRVGMQMACQNKPLGGFWTSGYKESIKGSEWTDWKRRNQPKWRTGMGAVFKVIGNPKLAVVKNNKDYEKLLKKYGIDVSDMGCSGGQYYLNWHKLAKDFDGFRLTSRGARDFIPGVHEWDIESTVWFNMGKLEFIGTTKV